MLEIAFILGFGIAVAAVTAAALFSVDQLQRWTR
jgi:hypothetical protein